MNYNEYLLAVRDAKGPQRTFELHREYYAQFVGPLILGAVSARIGVERIMQTSDPHINEIPLYLWDRLHPFIRVHCIERTVALGNSRTWSLSDSVCVAKEAARILKELGKP